MSSETAIVAAGYRIQEWAEQIRACQNRPAGMSAADWCTHNGITKANYYYRLRRVRAVCFENIPEQIRTQQVVPVDPELLQKGEKILTRRKLLLQKIPAGKISKARPSRRQ